MSSTSLSEPVLRFQKSVEDSDIDKLCVQGERHMLCVVLQKWSLANGFAECAFQVKRLFRDWANNNHEVRAANLVRGFGYAFQGNEVGVLGGDILGSVLKSPKVEIRDAAIMALESWCEGDDVWLNLVASHREHEETNLLKDYCTQILASYEWHEWEGSDEEEGDEVTAGAYDRWGPPCYAADFLEPPVVAPPEVEEFLVVTKPLALHMVEAKQLPVEKLQRVLTNLVGLHKDTVLDLIESYRIGRKTARHTSLNVWVGDWTGGGKSLYVWTKEWGVWMSDESTYSTGPSEGSRWHIKLFA
jgi:hypothetical protein